MMQYAALILSSALAFAACAPSNAPQDSGVGFGNYDEYLREQQVREQQAREAALRGQPQTVAPPERAAADIPVPTEGRRQAHTGISDEQDFEAVSGRESIQSDAERITANRQRYVVIQPTDLPARPDNSGAGIDSGIVDFALATDNPVGQPIYRRTNFLSGDRFNRNCAKYSSSDLAQRDFLAKGGPARDRMGIDPDGDGFACYWDPEPFRAARRAAFGN